MRFVVYHCDMSFASRRVWLALILLLVAFAVRVIGLDVQSFWYDEGYSVMFVRHSLGYVVSQAGPLELNTPLYYVILFFWTRLAGESEFSARLVSAFAGVLTVALAAPLAWRIAGRAAGLWALALMALWPVNVAVSQEARMYALVTLLAVASFVVLAMRCLRAGGRNGRAVDWAVWAGLCLAAFSAHVLAAFIIAGQVVVILARIAASLWRARRTDVSGVYSEFRFPLLAIAVIALITGVWTLWLISFRPAYGTSFSDPLDWAGTLTRSAASLILPRNLPDSLVPQAAGLASVVILGMMIASPQARAVVGGSLIGLIGIAAFCALTGKYAARYSAIVAPLLAVAVGMALGAATRHRTRLATLTGAICLMLAALGVWAWRADPLYANEDFRGAAAYLRVHAASDERVVLVSGHFAPVFAYYYGDAGWIAVPDDPVLNIRHVLDYDLAAPYLNRDLAGASGAWLLEWQQDVIDPTHIVTELLRRQARGRWYQEHTPAFHNLRLRHFRFARPYQPTPIPLPFQSQVDVTAGPAHGLGALGCHVFKPPRAGDAAMEVACFWTLTRFSGLPLDTRVSLRLVNADGVWVAQSDQYLAAPYGLPNVTLDKSLAAFYVMEIPPDLPAGQYQFHAVPYIRVGPEETLEIAPRIYVPVDIKSHVAHP